MKTDEDTAVASRTASLHSRYGTAIGFIEGVDSYKRKFVFILFWGLNLLFKLKLNIYCHGISHVEVVEA